MLNRFLTIGFTILLTLAFVGLLSLWFVSDAGQTLSHQIAQLPLETATEYPAQVALPTNTAWFIVVTSTPIPPTDTPTPVPPTATFTPAPPTATPTNTTLPVGWVHNGTNLGDVTGLYFGGGCNCQGGSAYRIFLVSPNAVMSFSYVVIQIGGGGVSEIRTEVFDYNTNVNLLTISTGTGGAAGSFTTPAHGLIKIVVTDISYGDLSGQDTQIVGIALTAAPPTFTPVPPTATETWTPVPPTDTPQPPTDTPGPPTDTPTPSASPTPSTAIVNGFCGSSGGWSTSGSVTVGPSICLFNAGGLPVTGIIAQNIWGGIGNSYTLNYVVARSGSCSLPGQVAQVLAQVIDLNTNAVVAQQLTTGTVITTGHLTFVGTGPMQIKIIDQTTNTAPPCDVIVDNISIS